MQKRAIFFDRDGVLNQAIVKNGKPYPPASLQELKIYAESAPAIQSLKKAGYLLIGATNQPDVARGTTPISLVEAINNEIINVLGIDEIRVCSHDDRDACACRKPEPGLLLDAANDYNIDLKNSFMVGDRWKDIEAGQRAGCKTIWINQNYAEKSPEKSPDFEAKNLSEALHWILNLQN